MSSTTRPPGLASGRVGSCQTVIGPQDTCKASGTGDLDVLATPRVLALFECAAIDALGGVLGSELTTVGVRVLLEHLLPVAIGVTVRATATLISVRGRRLVFVVRLNDAQERAVGVGRLTRAVVERETFTPPAP